LAPGCASGFRLCLESGLAGYRPLPGSFPTLRELLAIMKEHPGLKLEIDGFVCCMPETMDGWDIETKKQDLSVQRAKYVYDYLARRGIDTTG
jgi:outer membrane protein OmpA-like peptidoglycan-associated protein